MRTSRGDPSEWGGHGDHEQMTAQQRVQLNHVAKHLHSKFHGIFGLETIEAFVFESYDDLAKTATVTK